MDVNLPTFYNKASGFCRPFVFPLNSFHPFRIISVNFISRGNIHRFRGPLFSTLRVIPYTYRCSGRGRISRVTCYHFQLPSPSDFRGSSVVTYHFAGRRDLATLTNRATRYPLEEEEACRAIQLSKRVLRAYLISWSKSTNGNTYQISYRHHRFMTLLTGRYAGEFSRAALTYPKRANSPSARHVTHTKRGDLRRTLYLIGVLKDVAFSGNSNFKRSRTVPLHRPFSMFFSERFLAGQRFSRVRNVQVFFNANRAICNAIGPPRSKAYGFQIQFFERPTKSRIVVILKRGACLGLP